MHGVLPGQTVDHQQCLTGIGDVADRLDLLHQLFVDGEPAGGVEHVDVIPAHARLRPGALGDGDRGFALDDRQGVDPDLGAEDLQLLHRRGAVHVERGHEDALALPLFQPFGELGGRRRLARALKPDHQDRGRRIVDLERAGLTLAGQHMHQLVMHDLDDLLTRRDGFRHRLAGGLVLHGFDKVARDR